MNRSVKTPPCNFTASEDTDIYSTLPEKAAEKAPARANKKKSHHFLWVWAIVTAASVMLGTVCMQMELYTLTAEEKRLSQELEELRSRKSVLQIQYEELFDLQRLEQTATEELGMCRPGKDQIIRLELAEEEVPVEKSGVISELCGRIRAYFRHWL